MTPSFCRLRTQLRKDLIAGTYVRQNHRFAGLNDKNRRKAVFLRPLNVMTGHQH